MGDDLRASFIRAAAFWIAVRVLKLPTISNASLAQSTQFADEDAMDPPAFSVETDLC